MGGRSPSCSARDIFVPHRLHAIAVLAALMTMVGFAVVSSPAQGKAEYLAEFNQRYGTSGSRLDSCQTCHTSTPDAEHVNPYGTDFAKNKHDFAAIESLDSDADGSKNIDEIKSLTFPGDPKDYPGSKPPPKPSPTTTTTTAPWPISAIPNLPQMNQSEIDVMLSILDGKD